MTDAPDSPASSAEPEAVSGTGEGAKADAAPARVRSPEQTARAQRLAAALRDNLRRRKAPGRSPASN